MKVIPNRPHNKVFHAIFVVLILSGILFCASCRKDFEYRESMGRLEFSKDTVFLDTVFTNIGSSTYSLKVYNRTGDDIIIPSVVLEQGLNSNYRLNVDGLAGKVFEDVTILARDSIFIFIETTFDISQINQNEFLYTDVLQFISSVSTQEVPLVTLIKDAVFLFPSVLSDGTKETIPIGTDQQGNEIRVEGFFLEDSQLNFSNEKPYVIYGYAAVPENRTLNIEAGSRIHFHRDSGILVNQGASLNVNGSLSTDPDLLDNEVVFEGDRLEPEFADEPGQWGTIWLAPGSIDHDIDYCTIRNATVGLLLEGQDENGVNLQISNSQIHNSASVNLWARSSQIDAENLVLGSAGEASLICDTGGSYEFRHTTIANYWNDGFRSGSALQLSNFGTSTTGVTTMADLETANFSNCIIDGNAIRELFLRTNGINSFNFNFESSLIKFNDINGLFEEDPLYDFDDTTFYTDIILNGETDFIDAINDDFQIGESSVARDTANLQTALLVPLDILGRDRTSDPDLGAFEYVPED